MAKTLESLGIPTAHICSIVPISEAVGANRIIPATGIPYPTGNPELPADEEFTVRKKMVQKALDSLKTTIEEQTVIRMIKKTFFPIAFFFIAISWIAAEKNMDIWWIPVTAGIGIVFFLLDRIFKPWQESKNR